MRLTARIDEERKGNIAILQLGILAGTCHDLITALTDEDERFKAMLPKDLPQVEADRIPNWTPIRGLTHVVDTDTKFDLESLYFLIDNREESSLLSYLYLSAQRHRTLFAAVHTFAELRNRAEEKLVASGLIGNISTKQLEDIPMIVGINNHAKLLDLAGYMRKDAPITIAFLQKTANDLSRALDRKFKCENPFVKLMGRKLTARWVFADRTLTHRKDTLVAPTVGISRGAGVQM